MRETEQSDADLRKGIGSVFEHLITVQDINATSFAAGELLWTFIQLQHKHLHNLSRNDATWTFS